jgi:RNA polymerase sigma factor (sigma-70 family)
MFGAVELTNDLVAAAAGGAVRARAQLLEALRPQARLMVLGRLSPTPAQWGAIEELGEQVLLALAEGLGRLEQCTVYGLRAFLSGIVAHKVADFLRTDGKPGGPQPAIRSLESTVVGFSGTGPLYEFLSASGTSPLSAVVQAEQLNRLMSEYARLKATYRQVITLAFFDQLPVAEIARQTQLTPAAASMLLIRAVRTLRHNMTRPGPLAESHERAD